MELLLRDQAIRRIKDIRECKFVRHLRPSYLGGDTDHDRCLMRSGAIKELMAIFDIKEEEL